MLRDQIEDQIISAQLKKGVDKFWAYSALSQIRQVLATNKYFVDTVYDIKVTVSSLKFSKKIVIKTDCIFPDSDKILSGIIIYTFKVSKSGQPIGHRVTHKVC